MLTNKNNEILKQDRGSIIVFTVLMLTAILTITLTLTRIFIPRLRSITEATDSIGAVYAADSAMEWCPSTCPGGETLNYRTVGTFRGVSRSFEISEL